MTATEIPRFTNVCFPCRFHPPNVYHRSGRIVFDLGLHLDASFLLQKGVVTEEDLYVRSRAFWGVWVFDKEFSALVGRPSTLRDVQITCPKPDYWELDDFVSRAESTQVSTSLTSGH